MGFARELRGGKVKAAPTNNHDLILLLDNVYDTFNVGGMYRVGDAAGVSHIYHCGHTPISPDPKIKRAAVGLDDYLKHSAVPEILTLVKELKNQGYTIISLEQTALSKPFNEVSYRGKIALVAGNETFGVNPEVIAHSDLVVELPMHGINKSLNVVVATGIVLYQIRTMLAS